MLSIIILLLTCVSMVTSAGLAPVQPFEHCLHNYTDCGATDVTPSSLYANPENPQRYRILSKLNNTIYIGGLREFIQIDPACSGNELDPWLKRSIEIQSCRRGNEIGFSCEQLKGPRNPMLTCDNYIRIVELVNDTLLVCGTGSSHPRCYSFNKSCDLESDGKKLNLSESCQVEESYEAFDSVYHLAPRNWDINGTLAYIGGELFVGGSKNLKGTDAFVGKLDVTDTFGNFKHAPYTNDLDTYVLESRSVSGANFVGRPYQYSRESGSYVLFFFRETAVEHINQGKIMYSRVARVCQNDLGNFEKWSSYLKIRLNCSRQGEYPEYFNEIQDFSPITINNKVYFYAIFTQQPNAPAHSAVCIFSLDSIHQVFQTSSFKSPRTSKSTWLPVDAALVPSPRPGFMCSDPSDDTSFLASNPLLNDLAENYNYKEQTKDTSDQPLFYSIGTRFSRIALDSRGGDSFNNVVIFIGTESGEIWKVTDPNGGNHDVYIVKYWRAANGSPITGLALLESDGKTYLYATTHENIIKIDLQYGHAQSQTQFNKIYPPYLAPNSSFTPSGGLISHKINGTYCNDRQLLILCEGHLDPALAMEVDTKWLFKNDSMSNEIDITEFGLGHFITHQKVRSNVNNPMSYLIIRTHPKTSGQYICVISWEGEARETSEIIVETCITQIAEESRRAIHIKEKEKADSCKKTFESNQQECCVDTTKYMCDETCSWTYESP